MAWMSGRPRRSWLQLHRWVGLLLGPAFVLLGLTGSLLVFYTEIDQAIEPALAVPGPQPQVRSWQAVLDILEQAHPQRDRGWRVELPPDGHGLVTARYLKPDETAGAFFSPLLVTVNPASGRVLTSRFWGQFAATWVFDLHYTLLAGDAGLWLVGCLGLLMAVLLLAGLLLWWPRRGQWSAALRLRLGGRSQRRHYDLHKLMGLGGGALLLVLALTGAALALPSWVEPLARQMGTPLAMPTVVQPRVPGQSLLTLDQVLTRVQDHFPAGKPRWVDTPAATSAVFRVRLALPGDPSRRFPRSYVWVHGHSGQVLAVRDARLASAGDTLLHWLHPLHNGEAFGLAGRVLVFLSGLLPLGLALTGWLRWLDRRRAQAITLASTPFRSSHQRRQP